MGYDGTLKFDTKIDTSGFQSGIAKLGGTALKATASIMSGAAATITAMGTAAVKVGMDFEAGMSNVSAISGATGDELELLTDKAIEMGAKTKFSASEAADAFSYMAMAGWEPVDMLNSIEGVMNLAAASGEDLASTSDIVTDAMTAFGIAADGTTKVIKDGYVKEVSNATHFADVLAKTATKSNTDVGLMGDTFRYVAPVAGALGYTVEDCAVAIGLMANSGIKGTQAGTSLRSVLSRMAKPTKEVQGAMDALGVSLTDESGQMLSMQDIIGDLRNGFSGLSEAEKAQMAAALGGQEAMSGLLAIVNASPDDVEKLTDSIYDCDGAAQQMADTMNDNLEGQITILQSALEGLGISMYRNMQTPMKDVVKEANSMVGELQEAFNSGGFDGLVSAVGNVLAEIVQDVADYAPKLIDSAVALVSSFCDSLKNAKGIGEAGGQLITKLITALLSCAADIWTTAFSLIGELASGIESGSGDIAEAGLDCVTAITDSVIDNAPKLLTAGAGIIQKLSQGLKEKLPDLIPIAMQALVDFSGSIRENAGLLIDSGLQLIITLAQALIDNIPVLIETIPTIITNLCGIINDNAPKLLTAGISLIVQLALGLIKAIPTLIANVPQIIEAIVSVFTAFNWLSLGKNIIKLLSDGVTGMIATAQSSAKSIYDGIYGIFEKLPETLLNFGKNAIQSLSIGISSLAANAQAAGAGIFTIVRSVIAQLPGALLNLGKNAISGLLGTITSSVGNMRGAAQGVLNAILNAIRSLPSQLLSIGSNSVQRFAGAFRSLDWSGIGRNMINGIISGIGSAVSGLVNAAVNAAKSAFNAAKRALGIHSPSKLFADKIGKFIPPGIGVGMEKAMPQLKKDIAADMHSLADEMQATVAMESGKVHIDQAVTQTYKTESEKAKSVAGSVIETTINGEIHTHVELDGKEVGESTTPYVDKAMGRIDKHKKRGG